MIPARTTVITLGAHDMPSMRAFYRGLGWPEKPDSSDHFASFLTSGAILALFPFEHLAKDARVPASDVGTNFRGVTIAINVATRGDVDATIAELRTAGASITKEPRDESLGRPQRLLRRSRRQRLGGRLGARHLIRRRRALRVGLASLKMSHMNHRS